ncbi:MAG: hypothetical protein JST70_18405 [Bacteroidetes bacterium]|nr:hypothetical protein [Bacteroidota bacterium]
MITSSSIPYISQVLSEPQNISAADKESIDALIQTYPYFVPARYMEAANEHKKQPFNPPMMAMMQLYMGNWLLFNEFLKAASGVATAETPKPAPNQAAPQEETPQEETVQPAWDATATVETPVAEVIAEPEANEVVAETFVVPEVLEEPQVIEEVPKQAEPATKHHEPLYKDFNIVADVPGSDESFILPVYTEDYFLHQGMNVSNKIPADIQTKEGDTTDEDKQLMVVMSFSEWLVFFKNRKAREAEEAEDQKAVKTMWQKEKLAAALEEENEEIPEKVFEMAVNSITKEDDLASESLAEIHAKQGRYDKAIEMYRKLSLRNPQKKAYFARKIEILQKEKGS